jgi:hypothetical protein
MTTRMLRMPDSLTKIDEHMSNFDHSIDAGMGKRLREGGTRSEHSAWDFHGDVWFADGQFHEEVRTYHTYRGTFSAPTLSELMDAVNDEYGAA